MSDYALSSALWALAGLVVGYVLGSLTRPIIVQEDKVPIMKTLRFNVLGLVILGLALVSVAVTAVSISRQSSQVMCQTQFNELFLANQAERSDAAAKERQAQREFLLTPYTTPESYQAARDAYIKVLDAADAQRAQNPLPARPSC